VYSAGAFLFNKKKKEKTTMLKKTIPYEDYNGTKREEDFYFNLTETELAEMQLEVTGGLDTMLQAIIKAQDIPTIAKLFKQIILKSYGQKSPDGRRFIKSDELSTEFSQTEAYNVLYMELSQDAEKAAEFIKGIIPAKYREVVDTPELPA
jgi:hypothetical protein